MKTLLAIALFLAVPGFAAESETSFARLLPESRHQQYMTYGLFLEEQSSLLFRNAGRGWGSIAGALAMAEFEAFGMRPQLVLHSMVTAAYRINAKGDTLLTETTDARVGLAFEFDWKPDLRFSVAWTHQSGHISDDVPIASLIGPNLGNEIITLRLIHDCKERFRMGAGLRPVLGSEPVMKTFGAEQFLEWYPFGVAENHRKPTPYVALGFEQYGTDRVVFTQHYQLGFFIGNHLKPMRTSTLRGVLGYYRGVDPRLKFAQYLLGRAEFGYLGMMFEI